MILPFRTDAEAEAAIPQVTAHLRQGGLLGYPTETVYGLGSRAVAGDLEALAAIKGRPPKKPFLLLVASRPMAESYGLVFSAAARVLADEFWPGPLTLVLRGGEGRLPDALRGPEGGVAVRVTSHDRIRRMIAVLGAPLTSTSANRPGGRPAPGVEGLYDLFRDAVDDGSLLLLDGGVLGDVPPSTLVDCTVVPSRIIREGAIPREELRARAGRWAP
jgi:L-threonylcarbamoyladenylate synthase